MQFLLDSPLEQHVGEQNQTEKDHRLEIKHLHQRYAIWGGWTTKVDKNTVSETPNLHSTDRSTRGYTARVGIVVKVLVCSAYFLDL